MKLSFFKGEFRSEYRSQWNVLRDSINKESMILSMTINQSQREEGLGQWQLFVISVNREYLLSYLYCLLSLTLTIVVDEQTIIKENDCGCEHRKMNCIHIIIERQVAARDLNPRQDRVARQLLVARRIVTKANNEALNLTSFEIYQKTKQLDLVDEMQCVRIYLSNPK